MNIDIIKHDLLNPEKLTDISAELLLPNGKLKLLSYKDYQQFEWDDVRFFCWKYCRYGLPTIELIEFLKNQIGNRGAIEIGSGHGDLGYHLGIPMTDSYVQSDKDFIDTLALAGQNAISYPPDIEKLEALDAIAKYKPQVVVSSWVTHKWREGQANGFIRGVEQDKILPQCETYILIGNDAIHKHSPIMAKAHHKVRRDFLLSRATKTNLNYMYFWGKFVRIPFVRH